MHHDDPETQSNYDKLKNSICDLYPDGLSDQEAEEATQNLEGFAKLLLEIKCRQELEKQAGGAAADLSEIG